jgi:hypothetical protein
MKTNTSLINQIITLLCFRKRKELKEYFNKTEIEALIGMVGLMDMWITFKREYLKREYFTKPVEALTSEDYAYITHCDKMFHATHQTLFNYIKVMLRSKIKTPQ